MLQAAFPVLAVQVQDHLAVTVGEELMTARLEILAEPDIIVNFTVGNQPQTLAGIVKWLMSRAQVDDRKTPVTQRCQIVDVSAFVIGPPVAERPQPSIDGH